jgi:hypothetical protein
LECAFFGGPIVANRNGGFATMDNTPTHQPDEGDERPAGDLLVGGDKILAYLVELGWPETTDVYYLRRSGRWPIGNTAGNGGGKLVATKAGLARHSKKIARGTAA